MKQIVVFFLMIWLLCEVKITADPIISFFFREYPAAPKPAPLMLNTLKKPHGIAKQSLNGIIHHNAVSGIFSTYFGFLNASDVNGQTTFPRKQSKPVLEIIVTNRITPVMMFQATVSHWELIPGIPAAMYHVEQKEDPDTKLIFWDIQKVALPADNRIPLQEALIIIAKPQNVIIPTGITLTEPSANLNLPDMYVKQSIQTIRNALYVLNLSFLFRPIDLLYKKEKTRYETLINE